MGDFGPGFAEAAREWAADRPPLKKGPVERWDDLPVWDDPEAPAKPKGPWRSQFKGRFLHQMVQGAPQRDWLLKGVFSARTFFLIVGQPGCGKSFLTFDYVMTRALAAIDPDNEAWQKWFGLKLKPGASIYIAGEGQEDFAIRSHAWLAHNGIPAETSIPVFVIPTPVDFRSSEEEIGKLIAEVRGVEEICKRDFGCSVDLIIVDTFNKSLAGGDDTKPEHVGAFIRHATRLREETGVAVGAVHHTPRDSSRARGHGSVTADNDGEILVMPAVDGAPNRWRVTRNKSGPTGAQWEFRLHSQVVGRDQEGDPITSCVVAALGHEPSQEAAEMYDASEAAKQGRPQFTSDGRAILGPNLTLTMKALQNAIDQFGAEPPFGVRAPHGRQCVTNKQWLDEICRLRPGDDKQAPKFRDAARKMRDTGSTVLQNRGIIGADGDHVWRTDRRVASVDRPQKSKTAADKSETVALNSDTIGDVSNIEF